MCEIKLPTKLAAVADLLYTTRQKRLEVQKKVDYLAAVESACKERLINELPKGAATGIAGKVAAVSIRMDVKPHVEDWDAFYTYIVKTKQFELLQRRTNDAAIKDRWEESVSIPGISKFNAVKVSCVKR